MAELRKERKMDIEVKTNLNGCTVVGRDRARNFDMLHLWIDRAGSMHIDASREDEKVLVGRILLDSAATEKLLRELETKINDQRYDDTLD